MSVSANEKFDQQLAGIQEEQKKIEKDIENIRIELKDLKNCCEKKTSANEREIDPFNRWAAFGCGLAIVLGVLLLCGFSCWFMCFTWQLNHTLPWANLVVFVSLVVGVVAIAITALVTLTRRNPE
jgi:hypothetical protein